MKNLFLLVTLVFGAFYMVPSIAYADSNPSGTHVNHTNTNGSTPLSASSSSDTLVYYTFSSNFNYTSLSALLSSATTDFSHLDQYYIGEDGFGDVLESYPANDASTNYATAVSNNSYFTLTLNAADVVNVDSLVFEVAKGGFADPRGYFIRSSVDGFTSDLISETLPAGFNAAPVRKSIALGSQFDGVSSVTFRFYVYTPGTGYSVDWRNIYLKGSIGNAVPVSPWSIIASILLIGMVAVYRVHKKRNKVLSV